jgi:hypothetical protein
MVFEQKSMEMGWNLSPSQSIQEKPYYALPILSRDDSLCVISFEL